MSSFSSDTFRGVEAWEPKTWKFKGDKRSVVSKTLSKESTEVVFRVLNELLREGSRISDKQLTRIVASLIQVRFDELFSAEVSKVEVRDVRGAVSQLGWRTCALCGEHVARHITLRCGHWLGCCRCLVQHLKASVVAEMEDGGAHGAEHVWARCPRRDCRVLLPSKGLQWLLFRERKTELLLYLVQKTRALLLHFTDSFEPCANAHKCLSGFIDSAVAHCPTCGRNRGVELESIPITPSFWDTPNASPLAPRRASTGGDTWPRASKSRPRRFLTEVQSPAASVRSTASKRSSRSSELRRLRAELQASKRDTCAAHNEVRKYKKSTAHWRAKYKALISRMPEMDSQLTAERKLVSELNEQIQEHSSAEKDEDKFCDGDIMDGKLEEDASVRQYTSGRIAPTLTPTPIAAEVEDVKEDGMEEGCVKTPTREVREYTLVVFKALGGDGSVDKSPSCVTLSASTPFKEWRQKVLYSARLSPEVATESLKIVLKVLGDDGTVYVLLPANCAEELHAFLSNYGDTDMELRAFVGSGPPKAPVIEKVTCARDGQLQVLLSTRSLQSTQFPFTAKLSFETDKGPKARNFHVSLPKGDTPEFRIAHLRPELRYEVKVCAQNDFGHSHWSKTVGPLSVLAKFRFPH